MPTYALVDCNNFYVSCERVFNPKLRNRPVIVLSNNDGVAVARSNEAKALGVPMAAPYHKIKGLIKRHNIQVLSSNYTLYADMSNRVMNTLMKFTPNIEIYSIDESFLSLDGVVEKDLTKFGHDMRDTVTKWTGIPVSIGIAPTKTLAKIANTVAKKEKSHNGVVDLSTYTDNQLNQILSQIPLPKIWGIGHLYAIKLNQSGIYTALDFKKSPEKWIQKMTTITGRRTQMELKGIPCIELEEVRPKRQTVISSRSFGTPVTTIEQLREALATYISIAAEKLRSEGNVASVIHMYVTTNWFSKGPRYSRSAAVRLTPSTSYTPHMISAVSKMLDQTFKPGFTYKKAGVMLSGIEPAGKGQLHFFKKENPRESKIMKAIDAINTIWGSRTVQTAAEGLTKNWKMRRNHISQRFTTNWDEVLTVSI